MMGGVSGTAEHVAPPGREEDAFFPSHGEMAELVRRFDWAGTSLGPREQWPPSLVTAVGICLNSQFPTFVWWGPELVNIYNDAYAPVLGARHPSALGQSARSTWAEIWPAIGAEVDAVVERGEVVSHERVRFVMERNGYPEETYFTYSHSPIPDGLGGIGGLFQICIDETARVQAERERDRLHGQRKLALDAAGMGWWHFDPVARVAQYDARFQELFGLSGPQPSNEEVLARIHPDDVGRLLGAVAAAINPLDPQPYDLTYRVRRDVGTFRWIQAHGVALFEGEGEARRATSFVGTVTDISERREIEERDRSIAEELRLKADELVRFSRMAIGREQRVIEMKREVNGLLGKLGEPSRYALNFEAVEQDAGADLRRSPEAALSLLEDAAEARERAARSEERLQAALTGSGAGTFWWHLPSGTLSVDGGMQRLFGLQPSETPRADQFRSAVHEEDRPMVVRSIEECLREGRFDHEFRVVRPDGSVHWLVGKAKASFDAGGQPLYATGMCLDITGRKRVEEALHESIAEAHRQREKAEAASLAKDHFLAALSHELRTPLTPVLMVASSLQEDESLPAEVREQLGMIGRNVALEARLIDDLLDLTRITRGKLAIRAENCDVHGLLHLVVELLIGEAREKGIQLQLDLASTHPCLSGDPARLQQVFWNLLRNAVKFTPSGGHITVRSRNESGDRLRVEVADDGIGFRPEAKERIFKPFEQATETPEHRFGGLGLGLAIAHAIVELHGGQIEAESAGLGQGATFTVELPGASAPTGPAASGPSSARIAAPGASDRRLRLLLVEDHAPTLEVLTRLLKRSGHEVFSASSIAEARMVVEKHPVDAVLSDLGLPDGSGLDLMRDLRESHGLRGVALSGYGMEEDLRKSRAAGFIAHLVKPVDIGELRRALTLLAGDS